MGPYPFRYGKNDIPAEQFQTSTASMGPYPFRYGKVVGVTRIQS